MKDIDFGQGVLVALFMIAVVFLTLTLVYLIIQVVAGAIRRMSAKDEMADNAPEPIAQTPAVPAPVSANGAYGGTLKLRDVDEQTAAMIMAIVSDNSGIPLSELCFKSIRLVSEE